MGLEIAELSTEVAMLIMVELLVSEKDHTVQQPSGANVGDVCCRKWLPQVDSADLGPEPRSRWMHGDRHVLILANSPLPKLQAWRLPSSSLMSSSALLVTRR
jgi:hypothetical protein